MLAATTVRTICISCFIFPAEGSWMIVRNHQFRRECFTGKCKCSIIACEAKLRQPKELMNSLYASSLRVQVFVSVRVYTIILRKLVTATLTKQESTGALFAKRCIIYCQTCRGLANAIHWTRDRAAHLFSSFETASLYLRVYIWAILVPQFCNEVTR